MYCKKCGNEVPEEGMFCPKCGSKLDAPEEGDVLAASEQVPGDKTRATDGSTDAAVAPIAKRKVPLIAGIAVVAVAIIAIIVLIVVSKMDGSLKIDEKSFPDAAVRAAISQADADGDGALSEEEADAVTSLSVDDAADVAMLGTSLHRIQDLTVTGDALSSVDVSDLPSLVSLSVKSDSASSINASGAGSLAEIKVESDGAPSIDVTGDGQLSSIEVPQDAQVTGIEDTQLAEAWLPVRLSDIDNGEETHRTIVSYDGAGRIAKIAQGKVANGRFGHDAQQDERIRTYSYDDSGRLVRCTDTNDYYAPGDVDMDSTIEFSYDDAGRLSKTSSDNPGGYGNYAYEYDGKGNLASMSAGNTPSGSCEWDDAGNLTKVNAPRTIGYSYSYDDQGRVSGFDFPYGLGSEHLASSLSRDDQGRVVKAAPAGADQSGCPTVTYSYDEQGRLTGAESNGGKYYRRGNASVEYDARGNATKVTFEREYYAGSYVGGCAISYERAFLSKDDANGMQPGIVVSADYNSLSSDGCMIQAYVFEPERTPVSSALPISLDWWYSSQPASRK